MITLNTWFLIAMLIITIISMAVFFAIQKNINHVNRGYINILGAQNSNLIKTKTLLLVRFSYLLALTTASVFFYIVYAGR